MALRNHERHPVEGKSSSGTVAIVWAGLLAGDVGEDLVILPLSDITIHGFGVPDGSTLIIEGSGQYPIVTTRVTLRDGFTVLPISTMASPLLAQVGDVLTSLRPRVSGGGGSTAWEVWLTAKGRL